MEQKSFLYQLKRLCIQVSFFTSSGKCIRIISAIFKLMPLSVKIWMNVGFFSKHKRQVFSTIFDYLQLSTKRKFFCIIFDARKEQNNDNNELSPHSPKVIYMKHIKVRLDSQNKIKLLLGT